MAMYKVSVTVYKDPEGKTLFLPTFTRALGTLCLYYGVFQTVALAIALFKTKGNLMLLVSVGFLAASIALIALGLFLRRWSERRAQKAYLDAVTEMQQVPGRKTR